MAPVAVVVMVEKMVGRPKAIGTTHQMTTHTATPHTCQESRACILDSPARRSSPGCSDSLREQRPKGPCLAIPTPAIAPAVAVAQAVCKRQYRVVVVRCGVDATQEEVWVPTVSIARSSIPRATVPARPSCDRRTACVAARLATADNRVLHGAAQHRHQVVHTTAALRAYHNVTDACQRRKRRKDA